MRTIAAGPCFAVLRAAADDAVAGFACHYFPPYPHDGGARYVRTIAAGPSFAVLRAAADAAVADFVCLRIFVGESVCKKGADPYHPIRLRRTHHTNTAIRTAMMTTLLFRKLWNLANRSPET